jgi:two-component system sensor histidine kinase UhpB
VSGRPLRVLFVEDLEEDMELLLRELRRGGFDVAHERVESAAELRASLDRAWDVVVCDWVLPGFSAPEAIAVVEESGFDGPILVVSGSMGEEHVVDAMRAGAHDYVVKDHLHRLVPAIVRELREAEDRRSIRRADEQLRLQALIFENINDAVVVADVEGRIVDLNPAAELATGMPRRDAIGRPAEYLGGLGGDDRARKEIAEGLRESGRWSGVLSVERADGTDGFVDLAVVPLHDADGAVLGSVGVSRDVTMRIRAEERLRETIDELRRTDRHRRQLLSRLVAAQEEERQRIAGEIHDDPVQQLYASVLRLGILHERIEDPTDRETLEHIEEIVGGTIGRLRRMLFELQPRSLDSEGLGRALSEYVSYVNQGSDTLFELVDQLSVPLSKDMRAVSYRLILEAVSNVRKHARATSATITIADQEEGLLCTVTDDGRGFPVEDRLDVSLPGHLGLPAMRERAELAGGTLNIASSPGEGTTVEFWLPAS